MFVGMSAGFAEFYLLKSLGFIPLDCNKGHSASVSSFLALNLLFFLLSSSPFLSVSSLLVSLFTKGYVKKLLWTEDLNCQHLDYNRAHFQEAPVAENSTKMAPSQSLDTMGTLVRAFQSPCTYLARENEDGVSVGVGQGRVETPFNRSNTRDSSSSLSSHFLLLQGNRQLFKIADGISDPGMPLGKYSRSKIWGYPWWLRCKESAWDKDSIPGSGRSPGEGNGYPLQYSWLENPVDRGTWRSTVHGVTKSQIQLSN